MSNQNNEPQLSAWRTYVSRRDPGLFVQAAQVTRPGTVLLGDGREVIAQRGDYLIEGDGHLYCDTGRQFVALYKAA